MADIISLDRYISRTADYQSVSQSWSKVISQLSFEPRTELTELNEALPLIWAPHIWMCA